MFIKTEEKNIRDSKQYVIQQDFEQENHLMWNTLYCKVFIRKWSYLSIYFSYLWSLVISSQQRLSCLLYGHSVIRNCGIDLPSQLIISVFMFPILLLMVSVLSVLVNIWFRRNYILAACHWGWHVCACHAHSMYNLVTDFTYRWQELPISSLYPFPWSSKIFSGI